MKNLFDLDEDYNILYEGSIMKQRESSCGYKFVSLGDGKNIFHVHRIIAELVVDNPDTEVFKVVNHKDGDKHNNLPSNLEWVTTSYNLYHSHHIIGRKEIKSVVTDETIKNICEMIEQGYRNKDIRDEFKDLPKTFLAELRSGRTYKRISKDYNLKMDRSGRLSSERVKWVCRKLEDGLSPTEIYLLNNKVISIHVIEKIKSRDNFKDISRDYKF